MATKKPKRKTAKSKGTSSHTVKGSRLDRFIATQQRSIETFSKFAEGAADMTMKGELRPSVWLKRYAKMWRDLASDVAEMTRIVLK